MNRPEIREFVDAARAVALSQDVNYLALTQRVGNTESSTVLTLRFGEYAKVPPPPPPPPAPISVEGIRVPAGESAARLIQQVPPVYPPLAREARIQGVVLLEVRIAPNGSVENLRVITGHPLLAPAAAEAVSQWAYQPTSQAVVTTVTVNFALQPQGPDQG